jgi:hypothetical protein
MCTIVVLYVFFVQKCVCSVKITNVETVRTFSEKFLENSQVGMLHKAYRKDPNDPNSIEYRDECEHKIEVPEFKNLCDDFIKIAKSQNLFAVDCSYETTYLQKVFVDNSSTVCLIGDVHGDAPALLVILWDLISKGYLDENFKIIKDNFYIVFIGDYADRGAYGVEIYYLILRLKLANWDKVILIRGNHEEDRTVEMYGFCSELKKRYNKPEELMGALKTIWKSLPAVVFLKCVPSNLIIWCCHGGLTFDLNEDGTIEDDHSLYITKFLGDERRFFSDFIPLEGCLGFLLSDFEPVATETGVKFNEERGDGFVINKAKTQEYLDKIKVKVMLRGHQHLGSCVKLFSSKSDDLVAWGDKDSPVKPDKECMFAPKDCGPVVIFTTASVLSLGRQTNIGYGLLSFAPEFKDWKLKVVEWVGYHTGDKIGKYMYIVSGPGDKVEPKYVDNPKVDNVIDVKIKKKDVLSPALTLLKNKLLILAQKLSQKAQGEGGE